MSQVKTKQTFGGATVGQISPPVPANFPKALNLKLSFDQALRLHFGLGQVLGKIGSYNRSTTEGRRAAAVLCLYAHKGRITLTESRLPKKGKPSSAVVQENATQERR